MTEINGISKEGDGVMAKDKDKTLESGELDTVKGLRYNVAFLKWLVPLAITLSLGGCAGLGWLAKSALMGEIRGAIQSETTPIRTKIGEVERKMDRMDERQRAQQEAISEIKTRLK